MTDYAKLVRAARLAGVARIARSSLAEARDMMSEFGHLYRDEAGDIADRLGATVGPALDALQAATELLPVMVEKEILRAADEPYQARGLSVIAPGGVAIATFMTEDVAHKCAADFNRRAKRSEKETS